MSKVILFPYFLSVMAGIMGLLPVRIEAAEGEPFSKLFNPDLREVERQKQIIRQELGTLVNPVPLSKEAHELFPSYDNDHPALSPWLQVDLTKSQSFDSIALFPTPFTLANGDQVASGFPKRFRLEVSDDVDFATSTSLFNCENKDFHCRGILPVLISTTGAKGRYIRLTASKLEQTRSNDQYYVLSLSQWMVIQGNYNLAVHCPVVFSQRAQSNYTLEHPVDKTLTDGRVGLGAPVAPGDHDQYYMAQAARLLWIRLDLGADYPVDEVRVHFAMPQSHPSAPALFDRKARFRIEISQDPGFVAASVLYATSGLDTEEDNPENCPITARTAAPVRARYVRVVQEAVPPRYYSPLGLTEIQVYAANKNVAPGVTVTSNTEAGRYPFDKVPPSLQVLVDGNAAHGSLMELPEWLRQLDRRRVLTTHLEELTNTETRLLAIASRRLNWAIAAMALVVLGTLASVVIAMILKHRRGILALRMRLARDLHDEVGSNLAGISRLCEVAVMEADGQGAEDWSEVRKAAVESSEAIYRILWLMGTREAASTDLLGSLRQMADRMLTGKEVRWLAWDSTVIDPLPADHQRQVFLFLKEVIANIVKHANAEKVEFYSKVTDSTLEILVHDYGCGFDPGSGAMGMGLASLYSRARELRGTLNIQSAPGKGTRVALLLPLNHHQASKKI